jgi:hypothetical protein
MLRITLSETGSEQRWILEGRLTGSSMEDLVGNWRAHRDRAPTRRCVVDLNQVTFIDRDGEQVLLMMIRDGVEFLATGLYNRHLLESLSAQVASRPDKG